MIHVDRLQRQGLDGTFEDASEPINQGLQQKLELAIVFARHAHKVSLDMVRQVIDFTPLFVLQQIHPLFLQDVAKPAFQCRCV